jgi:protoheme IX farnesyltransferase
MVYGITALALGAGYLWQVMLVARDRQDERGVSLTNDAPAKAAFKYSIVYLFVLFGALPIDRLIGGYLGT